MPCKVGDKSQICVIDEENFRTPYWNATFPAPSDATLVKVHDAAERLSKALTSAANATAVVLATADFFEVLGKASNIGPPAPAPAPAPAGA